MSVTAVPGFVAAGIACGIKESGDADLALVATADCAPVTAAAVFTSNKLVAAPVIATSEHLAATGGRAAAVVLNSGNANAATGEAGLAASRAMCSSVAAALGCKPAEVLVCSTGLIGIPLPVDRVVAASPDLVAALGADGGLAAAEAIMTTDTRRKEAVARGDGFVVGGMAKGAAMLAPNMATMLAVLTTDAQVDAPTLRTALRAAVTPSFNALSVDGCQSTNDTVVVLASGSAGPVSSEALTAALTEVCTQLALQMADDAEGATKTVRVRVTGAASDDDAARGARKVADSNLVKCSWYGKDPYWGRVASELGSAGIAFDPDLLTISYGPHVVCRAAVDVPRDDAALEAYMEQRHLEVISDLGLGEGTGVILTNDLTHAYVDENMGTS